MKRFLRKQAANILTALRLLCAAGLIFVPVFSTAFYVLYITAGLTDMVDGTVARRLGSVSEAGARLDTAADTAFALVCLIRLLPRLGLPLFLYIWVGAVAVIKLINIATGFALRHAFIAEHTTANRIAGALLFLFPLTLRLLPVNVTGAVLCAAATAAAVQEGCLIRTGR